MDKRVLSTGNIFVNYHGNNKEDRQKWDDGSAFKYHVRGRKYQEK